MSEGISLGRARIIYSTPKAVQAETDEHGTIWVPKSQVHNNSEIWENDDEGTLFVNLWFAEKEGLA